MTGGQNIISGKKGRAATEFICGHTRILARHSILQPHRIVNVHGLQSSSDITLGTAHGRLNQGGAGNLDNCLDSTFGDAVLMSSTSSTKVTVLVIFN